MCIPNFIDLPQLGDSQKPDQLKRWKYNLLIKASMCVPKIGYVLAFKSRKPGLKMENPLSIVLDKVLKNTHAKFQMNRMNKSMVYDQPKLAYRLHRVKKLA